MRHIPISRGLLKKMKIPIDENNKKAVCKDCSMINYCKPLGKELEFNFHTLRPQCWTKKRKITATWTPECADDLKAWHGVL